ncbi:peroxiredoxin-like family protein [Dokdonia sp. Hel_I_53]|uniref:peroxiredoxin-like family protein n=1 Tax=Dokdonia sp. Hel_I_53 TaxID=1566287 RepID=UPI00119945BA|nr:peroxiredoxin-like family protein [Dokdonia sp. Hel_I_53]TVZ52987.1 peroxiredoxin [Dokdonia sp. Hel_I_53]
MILPRSEMPNLELELINGTNWKLSDQNPENFTLLTFYRGLHCPVCKKQLKDLTSKIEDFTKRGVNLIAISMDSEKRANKASDEWELTSLPLAYNLPAEKAKELGLHISEAVSDKEPDFFSEPAMFLVRPDGTLYFSSIQTMPFARPQYEDVLNAIDFVLKEDYPARGELKGIPKAVS